MFTQGVKVVGLVVAGCLAASTAFASVDEDIAEAGNRLGWRLLGEIVREAPDENVFISPTSIAVALGMTYNGARGETREEMSRTLDLGDFGWKPPTTVGGSDTGNATHKTLYMEYTAPEELNEGYRALLGRLSATSPDMTLSIANSIWYRSGFEVHQDFLSINAKYFASEVTSLDFSDPGSVNIINDWVKRKTNAKIPTIIQPPIDPAMMIYLINAVYFKGMWLAPFDKSKTHDAEFNLPSGQTISCHMMKRKGKFHYTETKLVQVVSLPYGKSPYAMMVILPKEGVTVDSLIRLAQRWRRFEWNTPAGSREGTLYLPKFRMSWKSTLNDALQALGIRKAFAPWQADLSGIGGAPGDLFISEVLHKTFVDVNEEGTEAAAATSVGVALAAMPSPEFSMRVDRPFLCLIRHSSTRAFLFIGKIAEPVVE